MLLDAKLLRFQAAAQAKQQFFLGTPSTQTQNSNVQQVKYRSPSQCSNPTLKGLVMELKNCDSSERQVQRLGSAFCFSNRSSDVAGPFVSNYQTNDCSRFWLCLLSLSVGARESLRPAWPGGGCIGWLGWEAREMPGVKAKSIRDYRQNS